MSASEAAATDALSSQSATQRGSSGVEHAPGAGAGGFAASTHLEERFALRCADLPSASATSRA